MSPFDPLGMTSAPSIAPLVPTLPIRLSKTEILTVVFRSDEVVCESLIPSPLRLRGDLCMVNIYWMHDAQWFGVYGESAVHIPVEMPDGSPAVYSPFLVLGSDAAVAAGRELYGQAKKFGTVSLGGDGDLLVGRVERNGIDVVTATMCWKPEKAPLDVLEQLDPGSGANVNLRIMPDGRGGFHRDLLVRRFADVKVSEAWTGSATLEFRPNAQVPVHLLPIREVVVGVHRTVDLTLTEARTVHTFDGPSSS